MLSPDAFATKDTKNTKIREARCLLNILRDGSTGGPAKRALDAERGQARTPRKNIARCVCPVSLSVSRLWRPVEPVAFVSFVIFVANDFVIFVASRLS
jgi:hypothetical protein